MTNQTTLNAPRDVHEHPRVIQGGMGIGVSNWRLARAVAREGQMGVVSGTALDSVLVRRLQLGDSDGEVRASLARFPWPRMTQWILDQYFIEGGKPEGKPFKLVPFLGHPMSRQCVELLTVANFVEVDLARHGHDGPVGINYLEKIQMPTLPSLLGAMLGGVDYILMGAGIPASIPGVLDGLARWEPVELKLYIEGAVSPEDSMMRLDPRELAPEPPADLHRPKFLAIVSSDTVARTLARKSTGHVDGFIVENHTAGGHNAPPRRDRSREDAAPGYGPKDEPNLEAIAALGRPFWLAGGYASPDKVNEAIETGAVGVQLGSIFAFCEESGIKPEIKAAARRHHAAGTLSTITGFAASPTGYPFKLVSIEGSAGDPNTPMPERRCDLGYLRQPFIDEGNGKVRYRCPAEPVDAYVSKGGDAEDTQDKQCLCNGLLATVGLGQVTAQGEIPPIVTGGDDFTFLDAMYKDGREAYSARDVIHYLLP